MRMKKLFAFLVLAGLLCLVSFAMAELGTGKLYVGGKDIVAEGGTVAGGSGTAVLSYKDGNPVLTLTNYTYQGVGTAGNTIMYMEYEPLTIMLEGENTLIAMDKDGSCTGINTNGPLVIDGTGSLKIKASDVEGAEYAYSIGIEAVDIAINGGKINVSGGDLTGGSGWQESNGIYGENITVNGGEVHAAGGTIKNENGNNNSCGIYAHDSFILNDGVVYADAGDITASGGAPPDCCGIFAGDDIFVNGGELYASGGKTIHGDNENEDSYGLASKSGNIAFGEGIRRLDIRGYTKVFDSVNDATTRLPVQVWEDDPEQETCDYIYNNEEFGAGDIKRIRIENDDPEEEDYSAPAATASLPKTGDGGNPALWLGMVLLGLLGAGVAVAKRR